MATYFITPTSPTIPTINAGDYVYFKRGGVYSYPSTAIFISQKNGCYFGAFGDGPRPIITTTNITPQQLILIRSSDNITIEGIAFDGANLGHAGILAQINTNGTTLNNFVVNDCEFYNFSKDGGVNYSAGISITADVGTVPVTPITGLRITNNIIHDNWAHGVSIQGHISQALVSGNKIYRNAKGQGAHGITILPNRTSVTTGFSLVSGNIYSLSTTRPDTYLVAYTNAASVKTYLTKNTSTPTTPALNEFGHSGTTLYVNVGENPTPGTGSNNVAYTWSIAQGVIVEKNESYNNYNWIPYPYDEGHGIAFDDYAGPGIIRGNYLHDNDGHGISVNGGTGIEVYNNIIANNKLNGINCTNQCKINGNTFYGNQGVQIGWGRPPGAYASLQSELKYNIVHGKGLYPAWNITSTNLTSTSNILYAHTNTFGYPSTNPITTDPMLNANFIPQTGSSAIGAGAPWWSNARPVDIFDRAYPDAFMDIGAVQSSTNQFHPVNLAIGKTS